MPSSWLILFVAQSVSRSCFRSQILQTLKTLSLPYRAALALLLLLSFSTFYTNVKRTNFCFKQGLGIKMNRKVNSTSPDCLRRDLESQEWRNIVIPPLGQQSLPVGPPRERTKFSDELKILKDYVYGESLPKWNVEQLRQIRDKIRKKSKKETSSFEDRYKPQRAREINIPIPGKGSFQAQTENPDATKVLKIKPRTHKPNKDSSEDGETQSITLAKQLLRKGTRKLVSLKEDDDCLYALFRDVDSAIQAKSEFLQSGSITSRFRLKFVNEDKHFGNRKGWKQKN